MQNNTYEYHEKLNKNSIPMLFQRQVWNNNMSSISNWHTNVELLHITSGTANVNCGTEQISLNVGDTAIINSNTIHSISAKSDVNNWCFILNNNFFENCGINLKKINFITKTDSRDTAEILKNISNEKQKSDFLVSARLQKLALELIIDLCTNHIDNSSDVPHHSGSAENYVKKAIEYINNNFSQEIGLAGIAEEIGITKNYLASEFKKHTGQTVITYLNQVRCHNAATMISAGMNITEAALESGFETLSYFSRTYKKLFGMPPSKIR